MLYFFMVAHKAACQTKPCQMPSWSLWRHGGGLAGARDISYRKFLGCRSALWCSFLLWSLPVLQQWSSPFAVSVCSGWSSVWLCLGDWWGWSFGSSGTLQVVFLGKCDDQGLGPQGWGVSCLPDLVAILVRVVTTSSPPAWTSSARMLSTTADLFFFSDCSAASTSLQRMGGHILCLSGDSSEQYSVHQFSISFSSVRHFPEWSWTVVAFPCFTVVKSFTSLYALLHDSVHNVLLK